METRELIPDKRLPWIEKAKAFDLDLSKLQQDINWAVSSAENDAIAGGTKTAKGIDNMTAKDMTTAAKDIQMQSLQSTTRAKQAIQTTIQIGTETGEQLRMQTEQIGNISKNVDEVESNLKRADKQLRSLMRRMATDRVIIVFVLLIVLAVIGSIVASVLDPNGKLGKKIISSLPSIPGVNITKITG